PDRPGDGLPLSLAGRARARAGEVRGRATRRLVASLRVAARGRVAWRGGCGCRALARAARRAGGETALGGPRARRNSGRPRHRAARLDLSALRRSGLRVTGPPAGRV